KLKNGHTELTVSIADVSYYVKEDSELDKEAYDKSDKCLFSRPCYSNDSTPMVQTQKT
ncbi:RNB domain-containing ribonuclease, partial [Staphylococcus aureus]